MPKITASEVNESKSFGSLKSLLFNITKQTDEHYTEEDRLELFLCAIKNKQVPKKYSVECNLFVGLCLRLLQNPTVLNLHIENSEPELFNSIAINTKWLIPNLCNHGIRFDATSGQWADLLQQDAKDGRWHFVISFAKNGANLNTVDSEGLTPLLRAIKDINFRSIHDILDVVEKLIFNGANVNLVGSDGKTPLLTAFDSKNYGIIDLLISKGATENFNDEQKNSLLIKAADLGLLNTFKYLVANEVAFGEAKKAELLLIAISNKYLDIAKFLVEKGAKLSDADEIEISAALKNATEHGRFDVARFLVDIRPPLKAEYEINRSNQLLREIERGALLSVKLFVNDGANVNAVDSNGRAPLIMAIKNRHLDVATFLVEKGAKLSDADKLHASEVLLQAISDERLDVATFLVENGARFSEPDKLKASEVLLQAISDEHLYSAKFLVELGARFSEPDKLKASEVLLKAIRKHDLHLAKFLVELGAKISDDDKLQASNLLLQSIRFQRLDAAVFLIENGAKISDDDKLQANELLLQAMRDQRLDIAKLLVENGANVNIADSNGRTSLIMAIDNSLWDVHDLFLVNEMDIENRVLDIVMLLVMNGANVNVADSKGITPLIIAIKNGWSEVAKFLVENGANVNVADSKGRTLLLIAIESDLPDVAKLLVKHGADTSTLVKLFEQDDDKWWRDRIDCMLPLLPYLKDDIVKDLHNSYIRYMKLKIVGNNESSMGIISPQEKIVFDKLREIYNPDNSSEFYKNVMVRDAKMSVLNFMIKEYLSAPAVYNGTKLPLTYTKLLTLKIEQKWTDNEFQKVLKQYYCNPYHTVYRAILPLSAHQSNLWGNANQVSINNPFIEPKHQEAIVLAWMAMNDKTNYKEAANIKSVRETFTIDLALIARAHNWDKNDRLDENLRVIGYDDGEIDRPSCGAGILKRIASSWPIRNSKYNFDLNADLHEFVVQYYSEKFNKMSIDELNKLCKSLHIYQLGGKEDEEDAADKHLRQENINTDSKLKFYMSLIEKYGETSAFDCHKFWRDELFNNEDMSDIYRFYSQANIRGLISATIDSKQKELKKQTMTELLQRIRNPLAQGTIIINPDLQNEINSKSSANQNRPKPSNGV